jgi:mRNA interferase RelE/StbE
MAERKNYQVIISAPAKRNLKKLPSSLQKRLEAKIVALSINPRPAGVKALKSSDNLLRLRVGEYRVVYKVEDKRLIVIVIQVGHRREVYRKL